MITGMVNSGEGRIRLKVMGLGCGSRFRVGAREGEAPAEPRTRESQ